MSCGAGHRCGSDPTLLWLCHRLVATALIRPLAWEPQYATDAALEKTKDKKKKKIIADIYFTTIMTFYNIAIVLSFCYFFSVSSSIYKNLVDQFSTNS